MPLHAFQPFIVSDICILISHLLLFKVHNCFWVFRADSDPPKGDRIFWITFLPINNFLFSTTFLNFSPAANQSKVLADSSNSANKVPDVNNAIWSELGCFDLQKDAV